MKRTRFRRKAKGIINSWPWLFSIITALVLILGTACGVAIKGPGSAAGVSEYTLSFEADGTDTLSEASAVLRDTDGNLLLGTESEDGL